MGEVTILHTSEAAEWASYLQVILQSSWNFPKKSVILHLVDSEASAEDLDLSAIQDTRKCILLLLSSVLLDLLSEPGIHEKFHKLLCPPHTVVVFLCGVSDDDVSSDYFEHWDSWKKLHVDDEPAFYVSTVLEAIASKVVQQAQEEYWPPLPDEETPLADEEIPLPDSPTHSVPSSAPLPEVTTDGHTEEEDIVLSPVLDRIQDTSATATPQACVTVQPERIQCGENVTVYIILLNKLDHEENVEMEFMSEGITKRVPGKCVNECTISGVSPDMPAGEVTLTLYCSNSAVCSRCLTYYTPMNEISQQLEKAADPLQFMCQAFNITCNATESLDSLLTESLKSRMPANGLQVFGISQLEEENVSVNQRDEELPTLLHFAAKYGLKKLTIVLLQCPGALQAYSVANKHGNYPNNLAERNGFSALRQFMDSYVETADMIKTDMQNAFPQAEGEEVYEYMSQSNQETQDTITKYSLKEDIYESMRELVPECAEDLYEDMETALRESHNQEDALLRKFFQVQTEKPLGSEINSLTDEQQWREGEETEDPYEAEEDPYNMCLSEQIYDTVEEQSFIPPEILNRPPAPIPRPTCTLELKQNTTYISRVFSEKETTYSQCSRTDSFDSQAVKPVRDRLLSSAHDPYAGMKTPGQRQLIALQERVKVGSLTVEEAVQEFKAWKFDQDKRSNSLRFQQDNIQRLRDSITRRQKEKGKSPMEDLDITPPLQRNLQWSSGMSIECAVYEPGPRSSTAPPPPVSRALQRGSWQTGSTSSNSSSESNRLSTVSNISYSSGAEGEFEDAPDLGPLPPRPVRYTDDPPMLPPPRVPPRIPDRTPESMLNERYIQSPSRIHPPLPPQRPIPPPPIPRRLR
ncbi:hypothetical protein ACEWY4_021011 [Coilia grayii]|uniref:DBB domain-containing protein n=1 Tax=Coilia grayii TaxID=363190 RepID=A0ABD1JB50_9TELE